MEFKSLGGLALHLIAAEAMILKRLEEGLDKVGERLEKTMRDEIGHYQSGVGPFPAWDQLAESTESHKSAKGFPVDAPLLASGEMRDKFNHERHGLEVIAGSKDPKMVFHEFGTLRMPARPVVGPAVLLSKEFIRRTLGRATVTGLIGGSAIHASLGYDSTVGE